MPKFSTESLTKLETCHGDLIRLFTKVIELADCKVTDGHRGQAEQDQAFAEGRSQKKWPNGNHNKMPSNAVDVVPYPIDYGGPIINDGGTLNKKNLTALLRFYHFAGLVRGVAYMMQIPIISGCDWDRDFDFTDQTFNDLPHYELVKGIQDEEEAM